MTNDEPSYSADIAKRFVEMTDDVVNKFKKQLENAHMEALDDLEWRIKDDLACYIAGHVQDMFKRAFEAMCNGDEQLFRNYIHARNGGYTGREHVTVFHDGRVHLPEMVVMRSRLACACREILQDEYVKDLQRQLAVQEDWIGKNKHKVQLWDDHALRG